MAKKTIFISFDFDNDAHYKNLLLAWDKNNDFDFELYNGSLKKAINSEDATYIKSKIKPLISKATHLLCVVGKESAKSEWINWEVETAATLKKKLIGVKIEKANESPKALLNNGATWALSFNFEAIKKAVNSA